MKSSALRAVALASSVSIGVFLIARANSGCSSETHGVAEPEAPAPSASGSSVLSAQPAAVTADEQFLQGSKAPGGAGLRPPAPAASSAQPTTEEFIGGSKSGLLFRPKPSSSQQNSPNPPPQQK